MQDIYFYAMAVLTLISLFLALFRNFQYMELYTETEELKAIVKLRHPQPEEEETEGDYPGINPHALHFEFDLPVKSDEEE